MKYHLKPIRDWENFKLHTELVEYIYSSFIPLVNKKEWHYLNFSPGLAIFEDTIGNTLYIDYKEENDIGEIVRELIVTLKNIDAIESEMLQKSIGKILEEFELIKVPIKE